MLKINMRDQVECTVTGFTGTVIGSTEWLNGCIQYAVKPKVDKEGKIVEAEWIDSQQLKVTKTFEPAESVPRRATGGPNKDAPAC